MLTFGWGEILLVTVIVIIVIGPKDLPKLIKQLSTFTKSLKKLSREFKSSLNEIADHEDFKDVKSSFAILVNFSTSCLVALDIAVGFKPKTSPKS